MHKKTDKILRQHILCSCRPGAGRRVVRITILLWMTICIVFARRHRTPPLSIDEWTNSSNRRVYLWISAKKAPIFDHLWLDHRWRAPAPRCGVQILGDLVHAFYLGVPCDMRWLLVCWLLRKGSVVTGDTESARSPGCGIQ